MVIMSRVTISTATRGPMLNDSMRFYLFNNALFLPWLTFFTIGRPVVGVICLILQITIIGWIPTTMGANQQKALKFHGILANLLSRKAYRRFSTSQILVAFRGVFLRAYNPMESIIFSSEKSYSPCRLKWLHRMTESLRMVSMSSFLRSSLLSLPSSLAR